MHAVVGASDACVAVNPSDMCVALAVLDAVVHVNGDRDERAIPFEEFHRLPGAHPEIETALEHGELITHVEIACSARARRSSYVNVRDRASYAFALASAAVALDVEVGTVADARNAFGGIAPKRWRSHEAENALKSAPKGIGEIGPHRRGRRDRKRGIPCHRAADSGATDHARPLVVMSELDEIVANVRALRVREEPFVLATVVGIRGSAYRQLGARMLASSSTAVCGSISAGCLEEDVARRGFYYTREALAVRVEYDNSADDDSGPRRGTGCEGSVSVLIERQSSAPLCFAIDFIAECLDRQQVGVLVTVVASDNRNVPLATRVAWIDPSTASAEPALPAELCAVIVKRAAALPNPRCARNVWLEDLRIELLVEPIVPAPHLFVIGSGPDALPVVELARMLGWRASICVHEARVSVRERFAGRAALLRGSVEDWAVAIERCCHPLALVMSHDYACDRDALGALLRTRVRYLGVLGPSARAERLLAELGYEGERIGAGKLARLHTPVGLRLGAETPAEIALSIVSEMQAVLHDADGARLSETREPIHDRSTGRASPMLAAQRDRVGRLSCSTREKRELRSHLRSARAASPRRGRVS